ncbi:acyl-CoA thioesterase [Povalibacter sp.]|uniref:acyl-CoA thioesterase n=1 Tax=Povalibacter sp. TaxID=1962978 RepID=UPI002F3F4C59
MTASLRFDLPSPHVMNIRVEESDIDAYQHVNNAVYVTWCDHSAWHHSAALGLPIGRCLELGRGMAVLRTSIAYLRPAFSGDSLLMATWLLPAQGRLCLRRRFQLLRPIDGITLARAEVEYACIELSSGRPVRWPAEFHPAYAIRPDVLADLPTLAPL